MCEYRNKREKINGNYSKLKTQTMEENCMQRYEFTLVHIHTISSMRINLMRIEIKTIVENFYQNGKKGENALKNASLKCNTFNILIYCYFCTKSFGTHRKQCEWCALYDSVPPTML